MLTFQFNETDETTSAIVDGFLVTATRLVPAGERKPSESGKTAHVIRPAGAVASAAIIDGQPVRVSHMAYISVKKGK